MDLHLTNEGYRLVRGSVKPFGDRYLTRITKAGLVEPFKPTSDGVFTLTARATYLFKLRERISQVKALSEAQMYGQATAKSSIGRLDVLARLIVDGMDCYERFAPKGLGNGSGEMYLEVTPITFPVRVKEGSSLSQLRIFYGNPERLVLIAPELYRTMLHREDAQLSEEGALSVDLTEVPELGFSAFCASPRQEVNPISLWKDEKRKVDPHKYWEAKESTKEGDDLRLIIEKSDFYILRSKERIAVPPGIAVYCRASDETIGEMRIHYAGFAHPNFGWERADGKTGTPLIFEVRGHDVNVSLQDDEKMARLICYRMSQDYTKESTEDSTDRKQKDSYNEQELELSNYFREWTDANSSP
jgi:dCTP deaminase